MHHQSGILGVLVTADNENIGHVSSVFEDIRDTLCSVSETDSDPKVFCPYVDFVSFTPKYFSKPGWTEDELSLLRNQINRFLNESAHIFCACRATSTALQSGMSCHTLQAQKDKRATWTTSSQRIPTVLVKISKQSTKDFQKTLKPLYPKILKRKRTNR